MKTFFSVYNAQFKIFKRDFTSLLISLILPLVLGLFFTLYFSQIEESNIHMTIVDRAESRITEYMINTLIEKSSGETGLIIEKDMEEEEAVSSLKNGSTDAVIIFPKDTDKVFTHGESQTIKLYFDESRFESEGTARQLADNIIGEINLGISNTPRAFHTEYKFVGENDISFAEFYLPNFLAVSILWLSIFATALPLVKQREEKILLRMGATPLSPVIFMSAVLTWRITVGVIQSLLFLLVGFFTLNIDVSGNILVFLAAVVVGNLSFATLGFMIAAISRTTQSAETIAQVFNFTMLFLSGVFISLDMLPEIFVKISYLIPMTYLADLLRQLMVGYRPIMPLSLDFIFLLGSGLIFTSVAYKYWTWK